MTHHLFPGRPAIGSFILLNGYRFEVIGTLKRVGRGDDNLTNTRAYIPFQVMRSDFPLKGDEAYDAISIIYYQPRVADEHLLTQDEARRVIGRNHHFDYHDEDAFEGLDFVQQAQMMGTIFDAMNEFLGTVGLVTLALGAIGVINIMLVAVTERTREIGLRKALGATNRSIMLQFFAEGILLTLISGLVGMAVAGGFMALLSHYNGPNGFDPPRLVPKTAILAIVSLTLAGVAAGLYPARKAARPATGSKPLNWFRRNHNGNDPRPAPGVLRRHAPQPAPHRPHHAGHGLGHRHRRHAACLRRWLRPRLRQHLCQFWNQAHDCGSRPLHDAGWRPEGRRGPPHHAERHRSARPPTSRRSPTSPPVAARTRPYSTTLALTPCRSTANTPTLSAFAR